MKVDLFDFDLPSELIAQHPARPRDSARMMHVPIDGAIEDLSVLELADKALFAPASNPGGFVGSDVGRTNNAAVWKSDVEATGEAHARVGEPVARRGSVAGATPGNVSDIIWIIGI